VFDSDCFTPQRATKFQGDGLQTWDTSNLRYMNDAFSRATNFDGDIRHWNTSLVVSFQNTFQQAVTFNRDLSQWDVSRAMSLHNMFRLALSLDQRLCWPGLLSTNATTTFHASITKSGRLDMLCESPVLLDPCCVNTVVMQETCCQPKGCDLKCNATTRKPTTAAIFSSMPSFTAVDSFAPTPGTKNVIDQGQRKFHGEEAYQDGIFMQGTTSVGDNSLVAPQTSVNGTQDTKAPSNTWIVTLSILGGFLLVGVIILTMSLLRQSLDQPGAHDEKSAYGQSSVAKFIPLEGQDAVLDW
jgi:Mycoplasma protein of unknown function, DUF285